MSLARSCIACLRIASLQARTTARPHVASSPMKIHTFSPTTPLLKKKSGKSATNAFEDADEFEEDIIDDVDSTSTSSTSSSASPLNNDYASVHSYLSERLTLPTYAFKSNTPSYHTLRSLLSLTARDDRSRTLEVLEKWRKRNLPAPDSTTSKLFVESWTKMNEIDELVEVLTKRDVYGVGSVPVGALHPVVQRLTEHEGEIVDVKTVLPKFEKLQTLNVLRKLENERDPVSLIATLAFALRLKRASKSKDFEQTITQLVMEIKRIGETQVVESVNAVKGSKLKHWATGQLEFCSREAPDSSFFSKLYRKVTMN